MKTLSVFIISLFFLISFPENIQEGNAITPCEEYTLVEITDTVYCTNDLLTGTYYHAISSQTNKTPRYTSDGSYITPNMENTLRWCGLSRDLLNVPSQQKNDPSGKFWRGEYCYGDTIQITIVDSTNGKYAEKIVGYWVVHDVMNKRFRGMIDFLVSVDYLKGGKWVNLKVNKIETIRRTILYNYPHMSNPITKKDTI